MLDPRCSILKSGHRGFGIEYPASSIEHRDQGRYYRQTCQPPQASMPEPHTKYQPRLHIVLHQPEIPYNTGSVGRTCVAVGAKLWLVRPLGFRVDDYYLRRAGLDYWEQDRKSTRLNSSHLGISYAVFCLKKKHIDI